MTDDRERIVKKGDSDSGIEKKAGYTPINEGYAPDDEQDSLPQPPAGGSGEKGKKESED